MLFDIVARILELAVIKFSFWQGSLEDVLKEVSKGILAPDFMRQLQISWIQILLDNYKCADIKGITSSKI